MLDLQGPKQGAADTRHSVLDLQGQKKGVRRY